MRGRIKLHLKALSFSLSAACFVLLATVFFYDGPLEFSGIEPSAQATVAAEPDASLMTHAKLAKAQPILAVSPMEGILPAGLNAQWQQISLDQDQVHLQVLKKPFLLAQTKHHAGGEAFQYASYLFEQMAQGVTSPKMASELKALSLQAQTMGNAVAQANAFQFAGAPTADMNHLQVRSSILYHLSSLNPSPMVHLQYNQHGTLLSQELTESRAQNGAALKSFLRQVDSVLKQPEAKAYPQTMQLIKRESALLKDVASHMTLRWESTRDCHKDCGNVVTFLRVYAHQTLPEQTLAAATI